MTLHKNLTLPVFLLALFFVSSCSFNVSTASISNVLLCYAPVNKVCPADKTVFSPDAPMFFVSCNLNFAPADTQIKFAWFNTDGQRFLIDEVILRAGDIGSGSTFSLNSTLSKPNNGWPAGNYELVISLNTDNFKPIVKTFKVM
ncbi:MAG TPA: hypothetical protein PK239_17550 [Chitinophagales bacterium]|nr:hypothetical protein [Chitinophagales bacterium]